MRAAAVVPHGELLQERPQGFAALCARTRFAIQHELAVDLIGNEEQAVIAAETGDHLQLVALINRSGRIVRIADDDHAGALGEGALPNFARREMKTVAAAAGHRHDMESGHRRER